MNTWLNPWRIALIYAAFGAGWILLTDWVVANGSVRPFPLGPQTVKGLLFVAATAALVYVLVRQMARDAERARIHAGALGEDAIRFREMAENIRDVFYSFEPALNRMLYVSPAYVEMWGRSTESLYADARSYTDGIHPDDRKRVEDALQRNMAGRVTDTEFRVLRPDGTERIVLNRSFPVLGGRGEVERIVGTCKDVTERAHVKNALLASETLFREMAENIHDVFYNYDPHANRMLYVSPAYAEVWGRSLESVYADALSYFEAVHEEDREAVSDALSRQAAGAATDIEYRLVRRDGKTRWIHDRSYPIPDARGKVSRIVGVARDVTDRKSADAERERLITAIDQVAEIILITDTGGAIEYVNAAFERVTGYRREDILGKNPRVLKSGKHDKGFYADLWRTISGGETWKGQIVNRRKDGTLYTEEDIISPVRDSSGKIAHFVAVKSDVTARISLEEQFRQSQKMEAIGQLAGGVAHDFNNMLTVILVRAEQALKRTEPDSKLHDSLREIHAAAERSAGLTRQLLTYARRQAVQPRVLDLNAAVEGTLGMLRRLIGENIELAWLPGAELWPVRIDPVQIDQLLANLCVNARDAIQDVGKTVIETRNVEFDREYCRRHEGYSPGSYVMLAVTDNGSGMDKETQAHLFEPFFTTKEVGQGTGLGLATVYGIVRQNRGFINVYSEPGSGTTFKIYLARHGAVTDEVPEVNAGNMSRARGETVLLVEDEEMILTVTAEMLEDLGYRVIKAPGPEEALRLAATPEGRADVLLTDMVMPGMNGRDLSRRLRDIQPGIRCVFMSGYTASVMTQRSLVEESMPFLQKPFSTVDLAAKLREALEQRPENAGRQPEER